MKEFDYKFKDLFNGLESEESTEKDKVSLIECHNLEPVEDDYNLHEAVISMNATDYNWHNNPDLVDYWTDNDDDTFDTHDTDEFTDI